MRKKIFLTGSEGFIGSHLLELLVKNNFNVKALCLYNSFNNWGWLDTIDKKILKEVEIISGDIRDKDIILKHTKKIDTLINLAALIAIPYSYQATESFIQTNVVGLNNILSTALKNEFNVIHTSTSEVYGNPDSFPLKEENRVFAKSPYAATKIAGDQLCLSYNRSFKAPVTILRPFNTFGPRQSLRAIIPTVICQAILNDGVVKLGNIYPKRNFNYVNDIADGFLKALNIKKHKGDLINLGGSFEISIKDLVSMVSNILQKKIRIEKDPTRLRPAKGEVERLIASRVKSQSILKWNPKYDNKKNFNNALDQTVKWYQQNLKFFIDKSRIYNI